MKRNRQSKGKLTQRFESISDAENQARWYAQRGRYLKGTGFFVLAALLLFLYNHVSPLSQGVLNIVNVAFQIFCVFAVLFGMLSAMSFLHGKPPATNTVD